VGGVTYALVALLGTDDVGPIAVCASLLVALAIALIRRLGGDGGTLTARG
jgi:hypothetical protein